jgi:hypothetical protein
MKCLLGTAAACCRFQAGSLLPGQLFNISQSMSRVIHIRLWIGKQQPAAAVQTVADFERDSFENTLSTNMPQFRRRQLLEQS